MPPKVSVIIVVFNGEQTIRAAVESVLEQTYANKELIIVDGLSTDNTIQILNEYRNPVLKFKSEKDRGIYDAMNKGISLATGEWIYFLGSDDTFFTNEVLENTFSKGLQQGCDLLYGNVLFVPGNKVYDGRFSTEKILFKNICHQGIFYKKEVYKKVGLYDLRYKSLADWHFNIKCFFDEKILSKYTPQIIARFAIGGASTQYKDIFFLREFLFPFNIHYLNTIGVKKLKDIGFYDSWWRLLRSLELYNTDRSLESYAPDQYIPVAVKKMFAMQKNTPFDFLKNGFISKSLMFFAYCKNLLTGT